MPLVGTLILIAALLLKQRAVKTTGPAVLIFAALSAIPTYLRRSPRPPPRCCFPSRPAEP